MTKQELINLIDRKKNKEKIALEESKKRLDSLIPQMQEDLEMVSILAEEKIILSNKVYDYSILVGEEKNNNNEPQLNVFVFNKTNPRKEEKEISFNPFNPEKKFSYYFIYENNKDSDEYEYILPQRNKKTYTDITAHFIQDFCDEFEKWHKAFHEEWLEELKKEF